MADASMPGGVQHGPADAGHLPTLSPAEQQAAQLALSKLGAGAGTITSMAGGDATVSPVGGSGTVQVGAGTSIVISSAHPPTLQSVHDQVVAGSGVSVHAAPVAGGASLHPAPIEQAGPTAAGIKPTQPHAPAGLTMPDQTKVNVAGVSPAHLTKHGA